MKKTQTHSEEREREDQVEVLGSNTGKVEGVSRLNQKEKDTPDPFNTRYTSSSSPHPRGFLLGELRCR